MTDGPTRHVGRRHAIAGVAGVGVAAPVLAACGDEESPGGRGSGPLTTAADVPVGGGTIFSDEQVVVTQPTEGDFKAFTAVCTHQGCLVGQVADGTIQCPCHGSEFSIEDGSVSNGPASSPLEEVGITVEGDSISLS
jgi:Rieske Fe-S protein